MKLSNLNPLKAGLDFFARDAQGNLAPTYTIDGMGQWVYDPAPLFDGYSNKAVGFHPPKPAGELRFYEWSAEDFGKHLLKAVYLVPKDLRKPYQDLYPNLEPLSKDSIWFPAVECSYPEEKFKQAVMQLPSADSPQYARTRELLIEVGGQPILWRGTAINEFHVLDDDIPSNQWIEGWWYKGQIIKPCLVGNSAKCRAQSV